MKVIYKYPITFNDTFTVTLPKFADILDCDFQNSHLCLWALVETDAPLEILEFKIFGTGQGIPKEDYMDYTYTKTVYQNGFVWHIFKKDHIL